MIQTNVFYEQNQIKAFEISGHADSGPYGYDLVCAGVSAVTFGAVNAIVSLCEIDLLVRQADDGGYLYVTVPSPIPQAKREEIQLLLEGMIISLETIEREYSQFLKISKK